MTGAVHVVDYGIGNLYSVARAIEKVGGEPRLTSDTIEIANADRLILPGVGSFRDGMSGLTAAGLGDAVRTFASSGRPLLGICLGMQMLATESTEYGVHQGLGILPGRVEAIPSNSPDGQQNKVPFIGWASLASSRPSKFSGTILNGLAADDSVYLVHSYQYCPDQPEDLLATYSYGGMDIAAAVARDNIIGCQFHPEKSGAVGLDIIQRFFRS